jgi:hypothetical protein
MRSGTGSRLHFLAATAAGAALGAFALAPGASAASDELTTAIVNDYAADGSITACRYTKAQLEGVRNQIMPDVDAYIPDLRVALNREIARWTSGGCGGNGGGNGGGGNGGSQSSLRASITSVKVAKNRRSAKVKLRCPSAASSSCKVLISMTLGAKKAASKKSSTISRGSAKTVTVKLLSSATSKLTSEGGKLRVSAKTSGSTAGAATKSVSVSAS